MMTLNEAIDHLRESLADPGHFSCAECAEQHVQLLQWLEELKDSRQAMNVLCETVRSMRDEIDKLTDLLIE